MLAFGIGKRSCIGEVFARSRMFLFIATLMQLATVIEPDGKSLPDLVPTEMLQKTFLQPQPLKFALSYDQNSIRKTYLEASVYINSIRKTKDVVHVHYHDLSYICILKTSISNNHTVSIEKNRWKIQTVNM